MAFLNSIKFQALLNLDNEVNVMTFIFADKLGFSMQKINIEIQKIDKSILEMFKIVIIDFML